MNLTFVRLLCVVIMLSEHGISGDESKVLKRYKRARAKNVCPSQCTCNVARNGEKEVTCIGAGLTQIPRDLPGDASTVSLRLNQIRIVQVMDMQELRVVKKLDLSHNKIEKIEIGAFEDMNRLEWLDFSHNKIGNISLDMLGTGGRSLKVLNVSNNYMRAFPQLKDTRGILLTALERLSMANNFFTDIQPSYIPPSISFLDLSCMETDMLTKPFKDLEKLSKLTLKGCSLGYELSYIAPAVFDGLMLEELDLSGNALAQVPQLLPLTLEYLDLSSNRINAIKRTSCATDDDIRNFYEYSSSEKSEEQGPGIGSDFSHLSELRHLKLNGNRLKSLCVDDFIFMHQLQILNLSSCTITEFHEDSFLYIQSLRVLDLSTNYIQNFKITGPADLQELYVQVNSIETVEDLSLQKLPSLKIADFSYNMYRCDCNLKDFVTFLGYTTDVRFLHLSERSSRYTCQTPKEMKDKSLVSLSMSELVCHAEESPFPIAAIAAPLSLVVIVLLIVLIITIAKCRAGKLNFRCCCRDNDDKEKKKVTSNYAKYEVDGDIVIQNKALNDVAILCHEYNHKWILNSMIPKLQRSHRTISGENEAVQQKRPHHPQSLNIELFTIGETIRVDTLHKCIDSNRKIALVITHEFLKERSCLYILKVIQERTATDPKDAVVSIILDAIPWSTMPETLQRLLVDKTFLQFPQLDRERQEFYFWDNLYTLIRTSEVVSQRKWQDVKGDDEHIPSVQYQKRHNDVSTIRSSRRAFGNSEVETSAPISSARAARLQRLGIKSNGDVVDDVLAGIEEARNLARRNMNKRNEVGKPTLNDFLISKPSSFDQPNGHHQAPITPNLRRKENTDDKLQRDIDDLYSSRKDVFRFGSQTNGKVHSLLPPNIDDVDSIYSQDDEHPIPGYEIRPPERDRSLPLIPHRSKSPRQSEIGSHSRLSQRSGHTLRSLHGTKNKAFADHDDVIANLHGTVEGSVPQKRDHVETIEVPQGDVHSQEKNQTEKDAKKTDKKKKNKALNRLKSFF